MGKATKLALKKWKLLIKSFFLSSLLLINAACKFESATDQDSKTKDAPVPAEL